MPKVYINSVVGRLEGMYHPSSVDGAPTALLLHPHSLYGGTMNNKIIYGMFKLLCTHGFSVLRINFRGVGRSDGGFDNGIGEVLDATVALNWLQEYNGNSKQHWVAGFSFGSYIALQLVARRDDVSHFACLSCPASKYNLNFFNTCSRKGFVLQGENDKIANISDTEAFLKNVQYTKTGKINYDVIPKADHFFTGYEDRVYKLIDEYIIENNVVETKKIDIASKVKSKLFNNE